MQYLRKHERASGIEFKETFGKDHADSFLLLESGRADAFVMDSQVPAASIARSRSPSDYRVVDKPLEAYVCEAAAPCFPRASTS